MTAVAGYSLVGVQLGDIAAALGAGLAAIVVHHQEVALLLVNVLAHSAPESLGGSFQHLTALGCRVSSSEGFNARHFLKGEIPAAKRISSEYGLPMPEINTPWVNTPLISPLNFFSRVSNSCRVIPDKTSGPSPVY
jgi:hypothetical protein